MTRLAESSDAVPPLGDLRFACDESERAGQEQYSEGGHAVPDAARPPTTFRASYGGSGAGSRRVRQSAVPGRT